MQRWVSGPTGVRAHNRGLRIPERTVLVVVPHMVAGTRLMDVVPLLEADHRVQVLFTVAPNEMGEIWHGTEELERAIGLDPTDFDAVSALGGAQRRLAIAEAPDHIDWDVLKAARDSYERASKLAPRDTYPLLNLARTDLLLSHVDPARVDFAKAQFARVLPLCLFEWDEARVAAEANDAEWSKKQAAAYKAFDYADCLLFSGRIEDGV